MPSYRHDERTLNYTIGNEIQQPRGDFLGLPAWIFHPIEAAKCFFNVVMTEVEDYAVLPMTLIGGGLVIYYLRKTPSL